MTSKFCAFLEYFWDWIDSRAIMHRGVLWFTLWMSLTETWHAWEFATTSKFDGLGTASIIAAVLVPLGAVQAFAFNMYTKRRSKE